MKFYIMKTMRVLSISLSACLFFLFAGGCGSGVKYYKKPDFAVGNVKKIAVLPIDDLTSDPYAGDRIRKMIITDVLSRGIDVVEPGEVTKDLIELRISSLQTISLKDIQSLTKTLGVDAVITGSAEAYGISTGIAASYPEVTVSLALIDAASGSIQWSVSHTSEGPNFWTRHFGAEGMTLSETARKVVKEAVDTLFQSASTAGGRWRGEISPVTEKRKKDD